MDGFQPTSAQSTIMIRARKIRERMILEMVSGASISDKDVFLSLCFQHEREFTDIRASESVRMIRIDQDMEDKQYDSYWLDEWKRWDESDWGDWHKHNAITGAFTSS